jgi:glutamate---cysteine ligase / carboxylate-amine ligase
MSSLQQFKENINLSMGVELELQLVNLKDFDLSMEAEDFLRRLSEVSHSGEIKPELTKAMIELNSSIHINYESLIKELNTLRTLLTDEARKTHIGVCGGGTHPFQKWKYQRIFQNERFASISEQYGYLAKQFTVFGQHIHIGCQNGDDALYLCHALARYIPHFIALSASSPFNQNIDTAFDCSRLAVISAFPLSGTPPWIFSWDEFGKYFNKMADLKVVTTMKDFYWDIRPKPEYGTIELRICDTPLTIEKAAYLGAYMQLLVSWLLQERPIISRDIYLTYLINRFRAARYGLNAIIVDPIDNIQVSLAEDILSVCDKLKKNAMQFQSEKALNQIKHMATVRKNDADWMRISFNKHQTLNETVRDQVELWKTPSISNIS